MKEEYLIDKTKFSDGPWKEEPDRVHWIDDRTGLDCLIMRHNKVGHLCGYVGVEKDHPCYAQNYDKIEADVHGGLTYSQDNQHNKYIRHPESDEKVIWWIGFDCAHLDDKTPYEFGLDMMDNGSYKDITYVSKEVTYLASQLGSDVFKLKQVLSTKEEE